MNILRKIEQNYALGGRFIVSVGGCIILGAQLGDSTGSMIGALAGLFLFAWTLKK